MPEASLNCYLHLRIIPCFILYLRKCSKIIKYDDSSLLEVTILVDVI